MAATEAVRDACAAHTTSGACTGDCTWTAPLTFDRTQPEAPWAEDPEAPVFRKRVNRALDFSSIDNAAPATQSASL